METATSIEPFDPSKLRETISERIRLSFLNLIPDSAWAGLVDKEINSFFEDKRDSWGKIESPSPFKKLIRTELEAMATKAIKAELEKPEYNGIWQENTEGPSEAVKKIIADNMDRILNAAFGSSIQMAVQTLRNNLGRY